MVYEIQGIQKLAIVYKPTLYQYLNNLMHKFVSQYVLFHASTCFEQMFSSSEGQNCITQPLASSHL